ncbi:MAG: RdgB/HAM1 family non-canonical purine NTP pyrophosphatase [Planctomycetes bacterium]|nr:RdgB/HAM1 family non-canonical purine NTP pyrophosphatase [Planctomycetota bacterium]
MAASRPLLVLGTNNAKKRQELVELLEPHGLELRILADFPHAIEVEETGATFAENARLKAAEQAKVLGVWVLAEDSGLSVDALDGRPGVFSARYSGAGGTDASNNRKLVEELAGVAWEKRTAHYVCHASLSDPHGEIRAESVGHCHGRIRLTPAGAGGFGYDPYFEIVEYHRTFGELGPAVKAAISHRARALDRMVPQIMTLIRSGAWT